MNPAGRARVPGWTSAAAVVALIVLPLLAYRGALGGGYVFDDYSLLALSRFLDNPLLPFIHEHVEGGLHYRPMGLALWWLSERIFGLAPFPHYLLNIALLVAVAMALWRFIQQATSRQAIALVVALLFAVHPVAIGTAAWLSNRYELLAALFGLLALGAAWRYRQQRRMPALLACVLLFACGLTAKENTLALIAAACLIWFWPGQAGSVMPKRWIQRLLPCLWLVALVAVWLLVRKLVLPASGEEALFDYKSPLALFRDGMTGWFAKLPDYLFLWPRLDWLSGAALAIGGLGLLALLWRNARSGWNADRAVLVAGGVALILVAAIVQWPRTGLVLSYLDFGASSFEDALAARHYFMAGIGFAIALAGLLAGPSPAAGRRVPTWQAAIPAALMLVAFVSVSQHLARSYRGVTLAQSVYAKAAVAAIDKLPLPVAGCQIYLIEMNNPLFSFYSDLAVKALSTDLSRVGGCFVQTETASWYNLVDAGQRHRGRAAPFTPVRAGAGVVEPIVLGRGALVFANLAPDARPPSDAGAFYLAWQDGAFVDVSLEVREGRRDVKFACFRPPSQCP